MHKGTKLSCKIIAPVLIKNDFLHDVAVGARFFLTFVAQFLHNYRY